MIMYIMNLVLVIVIKEGVIFWEIGCLGDLVFILLDLLNVE